MSVAKKHIPNVREDVQSPLSVIDRDRASQQRIKILVIQQKMIGDVLTSTVICQALKQKYPKATIHYLVNTNTIPVILGNPYFDGIVEFKDSFRSNRRSFLEFLFKIKKSNYNLVIDAFGKLESNLISLFSGSKKRISFHKWYTAILYSKTIKRAEEPITNASTAIENRLRLVVADSDLEQSIFKPKIFLSTKEKHAAKHLLKAKQIDLDRSLIMISVLGSAPNKTLPFESMAKLIDQLVAITKAQIVFNYLPTQHEDAKKIYLLTKSITKKSIFLDLFAKDLRSFLAILHHCDILVGNEGGAVNMAKALDKPTFTIFSPWIRKKDWNISEDGSKHDSIHLEDIRPDLYRNQSAKSIKKSALAWYQLFDINAILFKLDQYLLKAANPSRIRTKSDA